jgi:hypothetical protein
MNDGKLWLENVKSVLDNHEQFTDLMVGTSLQMFVQECDCPEGTEAHREIG